MYANLISMMFLYLVWIVFLLSGMGILMHILRLDRPREVRVIAQRTTGDE